jgi:lysophospholipase L1-like esterase
LVVVVITSGFNDRVRTARSLGLASAPSNTPEGYADNLEFMVNRLRASYARAGGSAGELFFLFLPSHLTADSGASPDADREELPLRAYRAAAADLARRTADAASVDFSGFMTAAEAEREGWYNPYNRAHLTEAGYFALSRRVLSELRR